MVVDASVSRDAAAPAARGRTRRGPSAWVAMYHSVSDCRQDPHDITVTPGRLDRQLAWLCGRGLRGVSVRELLAARARGEERGLVGLTFDDGYADFVTAALPVLHRWQCTATVFLVAGRLGGENDWETYGPCKPLLDADGVRRAAASGMEIASHGLTHTDLTGLPDDLLHAEVHESRTLLAGITGGEVGGFCYPYGTVDERVRAAVRSVGYRYACAIAPGSAAAGDLALPRIHIRQADTAVHLELKRRLARAWGRALEKTA
ncbi:polysaccharide deacetylase [Streptomyces cellostaticus]|uniref:Polysaccharide deacetylase n=1 Tax=Streptomyces cellostaticus TaxID=67285 RepID=A0A101NI98_9ACTN|nr:polysaccharide deacetylase family protein [Streptomyces cellostaticus]KUM93714.1 polysaccharide deacetylase [Streptomyces cellostaticus]GHI07620.1 polysaccharide deacetylase [Streptomyces cellostaticus]